MTPRQAILRKMGQRLREIRERQRLRPSQIADRADVTAGYISKLEAGTVWMGPDKLLDLARAYGVQPGDLMPTSVPLGAIELGVRRVPLLTAAQVEKWKGIVEGLSVDDDTCEFVRVTESLGPRAFALRVEGDAMAPIYQPGDIIVVDPDAPCTPGCFVVALDGARHPTFRQYKVERVGQNGSEVFKLVPTNDAYPTLFSDQHDLKIIGRVREHHRFL